jgi:hypothetical protein
MPFIYKELVLAELSRHGINPNERTPPEFVKEFVNDLYLYEIRTLRKRMRAGLIEKSDYARRVDELRKRYPILSLPVALWTETG